MKKLIYTTLIFIFALIFTAQIISQEDPFRVNSDGPKTIKSQDVYLMWMEDIGGGNIKNYQKVYRYKVSSNLEPSGNYDTMLTKTVRREETRPGKNSYVDVASGRFNVDPYDDIVSVWRTGNSNQKIEIMISHFDTTGFFTNTTSSVLDAGENINQNEEIYVRTGNFDADSTDEFIAAYKDNSDSLIFSLFDVDSSLQTTQVSRFSNVKVGFSSLTRFVKYFIETADLNGDGVDELISFTWENPTDPTYIPIEVRIYAIINGAFVQKSTRSINVPRATGLAVQDFIMAAAKGQFDSDESDEIVFSGVVRTNGIHISYYYILNITPDLNTITVGPIAQYTLNPIHSPNDLTEFGLATGDLNNIQNKRDEVVFVAGNRLRVCSINDDYSFQTKALINVANGGPNDYKQSNNYLKVSDVNMDNREDIILVKNNVDLSGLDGIEIAAVDFTDSTLNDGTHRIIGRMLRDESENDTYHPYAIAVGNFDGFDFKIGQPTHSIENDVSQPIVTVNAPPVHFDILGGNIYDINGCYNGGACDFWAKYNRRTGQTIEVSSKVNSDWVISAGVSYSGDITVEPMGVGISYNYESHFLYKYGEHFSKDTSNTSSIQIGIEIIARDDDRIYSTVTDYDVWEYPVYHGNESNPRNTILTFVPRNVQGNWYGSKSYLAQKFIPEHEVSNILSYYPYDSLVNNPNVSQAVRAYTSDRIWLDGSSSTTWDVEYSDFQTSQADTSRESGLDIGLQFGIYRFDGDFGDKQMVTHKTSISNSIKIESHVGSLNMGIGEVGYGVTPYAYWSNNDVLEIDYAVDIPEPVSQDSWWELKYKSHSDPTFILPWKLDPEKGFTLSENAKRYLTRDIIFNPQNPVPGDTLNITVQIRNFSLIPTPSPVNVKFFLNDPDSGGVPINGVSGTNSVTTNGVITARGKSEVEFKWVYPSGLPSYPRIYALLDQSNGITEIHEENNKGFNILGSSSIIGIEEVSNIVPEKFTLYQSYPNPFNPTTTIKFSIPKSNKVSIKIFDILGREVKSLINEFKTAGTYSVVFDGSNISSGVYFYQLSAGSPGEAGNYIETRKMMLIK